MGSALSFLTYLFTGQANILKVWNYANLIEHNTLVKWLAVLARALISKNEKVGFEFEKIGRNSTKAIIISLLFS
jgi:hypothetical protein